jgi:hypothetical protein
VKSGGNDYRPGGMPHPVRQVGHHEGCDDSCLF